MPSEAADSAPESEGIERACVPEADRKPGKAGRKSKRNIRPAHPGKIAKKPEHDAARLFRIGGFCYDEGGERVKSCDPAMPARMIALLPAPCPHGKHGHKREGHNGADESAKRQSEDTCADTQYGNADRPVEAPAKCPEYKDRPANCAKRLQHHAGKRQCSAATARNHSAAQPIAPDDPLIDWIEGIACIPEAVGNRLRHHVKRYGGFANGSPQPQSHE